MKKLLMVVLVLALVEVQTEAQKRMIFKMPKNAQYSKGSVLVKIKPEYKSLLESSASNGRTQGINGASASPLMPAVAVQQAATGRLNPPTIDISAYYKQIGRAHV